MSANSELSHDEANREGRTPETRWSVVLKAASGQPTPEAFLALGQLCEMYWQTLYRVARKKGQNDEEARDSVQGFICDVLESRQTFKDLDPNRGRFRNFLWTCFTRHLIDEYRVKTSQRSGGVMKRHSLDTRHLNGRLILEPVENLTPDDAFRKSLALDTFQEAFDQLASSWKRKGEADKFKYLQAYLVEECRGSRARTLARQLGVSEPRARGRVTELRQQFRKILRQCVAQTLSNPTESEIDGELDWLWESLCL